MKNKKENMDEQTSNASAPNSNPENKFKKDAKPATAASLNNIIKSAVNSAKAKSGETLSDEGTNVDYNEER